MILTCSNCGHRFNDPKASMKLVVPCPACHKDVMVVHGDVHGEATQLVSDGATQVLQDEATQMLGASGVQRDEEIEPTMPSSPANRTPRKGDSYVPFSDPMGDIVKEPGQQPTRVPARGASSDPTVMGATGQRIADPVNDPTMGPASAGDNPTYVPPPGSGSRIPAPGGTSSAQRESAAYQQVVARASSQGVATGNVSGAQHSAPRTGAQERPEDINLEGRTIGGYQIKKKLGAGGMGAVCLARQVSLDRDVALKILPGQFAANPDFLARFTREALSAAQLSHHNIMGVYDVGSDQDVHYISLEFVKGQNLGEMIRKDGKLTIDDAAGYVLQAARGLKYAHERGIIHRDIKPDNIMVNEHGVVKIADMGLAKISSQREQGVGLDYGGADELKRQAYGDLTGVNVAMGTPSYMAPEQGRDASKVDGRADQYSLGCTLYYLVAGKTPFTGKTTFEIISKHASEPLTPLEAHVKGVPRELSSVIERMLAKTPDQRYPSMSEVVQALEQYLDVESSKGPYTPREQHMQTLEREQAAYYAAPGRKLRSLAQMGFVAAMVLAVIVSALAFKSPVATGGFLGLAFMTVLFNFVADGVMNKRYLFRRVRSVFFGMSAKGWLATVLGIGLGAAILYVFGLLISWIIFAVVAVGLAATYQFVVARKLAQQRAPHLVAMNDMLKQLRLRGVSEEAIMDFVCRFSGEHWEEFFEDLFGYEEMIIHRGKIASKEKVKSRKKFATWRDSLARTLDEIEESRRKVREKKQLAKAEKDRLKASGLDENAAAAEAEKLASQAMDEGLLQPTVMVPSKADIAKVDLEMAKDRRKAEHGKVYWGFKLVRLVAALFVIAIFLPFAAGRFGVALPLPIPDSITAMKSMATTYVYNDSTNILYRVLGATPLLAGLLLLLTVFSGRVLLPLVVTIGTVGLAAGGTLLTLAGQNSGQNQMFLFFGALLAAVGGFVMMVLGKMGGGKF